MAIRMWASLLVSAVILAAASTEEGLEVDVAHGRALARHTTLAAKEAEIKIALAESHNELQTKTSAKLGQPRLTLDDAAEEAMKPSPTKTQVGETSGPRRLRRVKKRPEKGKKKCRCSCKQRRRKNNVVTKKAGVTEEEAAQEACLKRVKVKFIKWEPKPQKSDILRQRCTRLAKRIGVTSAWEPMSWEPVSKVRSRKSEQKKSKQITSKQLTATIGGINYNAVSCICTAMSKKGIKDQYPCKNEKNGKPQKYISDVIAEKKPEKDGDCHLYAARHSILKYQVEDAGKVIHCLTSPNSPCSSNNNAGNVEEDEEDEGLLELGSSKKTTRRGQAITGGFIFAGSNGAGNDEALELGESGRRGGRATFGVGTFMLSGGSNRAGNTEALTFIEL